jgi:hypothetical protein
MIVMAAGPDDQPTEMPEHVFRQSDAFRELKEIKRRSDRVEIERMRGAAAATVADLASGRPTVAHLVEAVSAAKGPVRRAVEWTGIVIGLVAVAALAYWGMRA